jgi:branched-chain amino acid transport system ATP-binding protein
MTMPDPPILETRALAVSFGGVRAVDGVDLAVPPGRLVGLIGPNGAGKTTTIDAMCGFVPARGRVLLHGEDVSERPPHDRARRGLVRTWQSMELFDDLTIEENCRVAAEPATTRQAVRDVLGRSRRADAEAAERARDALEQVGLADVARRHPDEVPLGQRKLAGVARALASGPSVLVLDEPAAGLDSAESATLGRRLRGLLDRGIAMLLVDHDMGLVLSVCDELYVLDFGRVIASGPPAAVRADERVIAAYLGREAGAGGPPHPGPGPVPA